MINKTKKKTSQPLVWENTQQKIILFPYWQFRNLG